MQYEITVTCASGVESVVKNELRALGFPGAKAIDGGITVTGSEHDVARLNMFLRCADRVYITLLSFPAATFDDVFDGVSSYPFADVLPFNARILVTGKSKKSALFALSSLQSITKKAILTSLSKKYKRSVFPENGETYRLEFSLVNDVYTLMLNTSGEGLHKRGWRDLVGEAPIKETLASALLSLSDFSFDRPFCDPFCGSGTIVIEAARAALDIAPGRDRSFDFVKWDFFDDNAYHLALEEARSNEKCDRKLRFYGFDIDKNAISLSMRHARRAGVADKIHLQVQDVKNFRSSYRDGCIVTNPPYGERLLTVKQAGELYRTLGNVWKDLDNWSLFAITSAPNFEKTFGQRADKTRKLYNSNVECRLYEYFRKEKIKPE